MWSGLWGVLLALPQVVPYSPPLRAPSSTGVLSFARPARPHGCLRMTTSAQPTPPSPQKVYVIGSGAVGCYYGGRLLEAGHDVTFLMRRDFDAVKKKGLHITSPDGDMRFLPSQINVVSSTEELEAELPPDQQGVDWVILSLKSTSFREVPELLGKCVVGPRTRVLALMNGLGLEDELANWVHPSKIFGGMAFICANRGEPGIVHHLNYGKLNCGNYQDDPKELEAIAQLWRGSKVQVETASSLLRARWEKLCWNIPFNGLGTILGGVSVDHVVFTPELRVLAIKVMDDVMRAANADLRARGQPETSAITQAFLDLMFHLTDNMGPYMSSTVLDFLVDFMFSKPLERAMANGVQCPYLETVVRTVQGIKTLREKGVMKRPPYSP